MPEPRPQEAAPAAGSDTELPIDENQIIAERRAKLAALREAVAVPFPNDFVPADRAGALLAAHDGKTREELEAENISVSVAGRMVLKRVQGKASFATLQDATGRIQLWMNDDGVGAEAHDAFKHWDLGDIVAAEGTLFKTKKGELSIRCKMVRLLTKSLRPLPDNLPAAYRSRNNQLLWHALEQIEDDIRAAVRRYGAARTAVIMGTSTSGADENIPLFQHVADGGGWADKPFNQLQHEMASPSEFVAHVYGIHGLRYVVSTACTSGARALISAARLLRSGLCDAVVCGGVDTLSPLTINGLPRWKCFQTASPTRFPPTATVSILAKPPPHSS